jgi:hypothetical protein
MKNWIVSHFQRSDVAIKQMDTWDIGLLKIVCVCFGLLLAKIFPALLAAPLWFYVVAVVVLLLPLMVRFLPKYAAAKVK